MNALYLRLIIVVLCVSFIDLSLCEVQGLASVPAENLVWKPYLQQLTDTGVIVLWTTKTGSNSMVQYSTDSTYGFATNGTSRLLTELGTQLHRVELTGLQPNTTYYYKIYTEAEDLLPEEILTFKTAPQTGSTTPFTFLAFGDYGRGSSSQKRLRDQMLLDSFSFILSTGDNAYSDGTYSDFDQKVFPIYSDIFKRAAIFPTLGNHDYHTNAGAPNLDLFDLPGNAWRPEDIERYYSFDYGNVHFVALDSNTPLSVSDDAASDDMFDWLRADLSQTTQLWKIVAFHHPAYSTGRHGSNSRVQSRLVPIFEEYGVDLVLTGHDHIYQRSKPMRQGQETTVEQGGIVYVVSGAGHQASYPCGTASWSVIAYCSESYGLYTRITVDGGRLTGEAIDETGTVKDYFVLEQNSVAVVPVEDVSINGPTLATVQASYPFSAMISPISTTLPVSYTWQATGQSLVTHTGGLSDTVSYTWNITGTQTITVTATNSNGVVTDTYSVCVSQGAGSDIKEVRQLDTNDAGLLNPAGLAYSFDANLFYIITANTSSPTLITMMTPFVDALGSMTVDTAGVDPINIAFDNLNKRLFVLDSIANELIAIETGPDGILDPAPAALTRYAVGALALQQPGGMTLDPENGVLFILDSDTLEIVRIEPDAQGGFDAMTALDESRVSRIALGATGLTDGRGLALNPSNGYLYLFSKAEKKIYELSQTGQFIATLDIAPFGLVDLQGLVFGLSGDLTDDPATINLYLADTGLIPGLEAGAKLWVYLPLVMKQGDEETAVNENSLSSGTVPLGRIVEFWLTPGCW